LDDEIAADETSLILTSTIHSCWCQLFFFVERPSTRPARQTEITHKTTSVWIEEERKALYFGKYAQIEPSDSRTGVSFASKQETDDRVKAYTPPK
jgi:hypothetical protein